MRIYTQDLTSLSSASTTPVYEIETALWLLQGGGSVCMSGEMIGIWKEHCKWCGEDRSLGLFLSFNFSVNYLKKEWTWVFWADESKNEIIPLSLGIYSVTSFFKVFNSQSIQHIFDELSANQKITQTKQGFRSYLCHCCP